MKLNRLLFQNKGYILSGEIDFSSYQEEPYHIKKILPASVKITGSIYEDLLMLDVSIKVTVIGVCSYTLEDVPLNLNINEKIQISDEVEDDEDIFYEKNVIFDIDPYILSLIITNVPTKIIKKGAKLPENGNGYRVISESDYQEEIKNTKDSRWNKLDDIDL